jgi:hypothetical protein
MPNIKDTIILLTKWKLNKRKNHFGETKP